MRSIGYTPIQAKIMDADSLLGPLLGDTSCDLIDCLQGQGAMSRSILEQMVLLDGDLMASAFPGIPERSDIVELDSKSVYKPIPVELMGYAIMRPQELGDTSVTSHENTSQADIKITQDDAREKLTLLQAFEFLPVSKDKRSTIELGKPCWNVMLREIPFRRQKDIEETINKNPTPLISFDVLKQFEGLARRFTEAARKRDEANRFYSWRFHRFTYVSDCPSETESESETDVKWTVIIFLKRMPVVGADYVYEYQQAISAKNGFDEGEKLTNAVQFDLTIELPPSSAPRDADGVVDYLVSAFNLKPEPRYIQSTVLRRKYSFEESSDGTPEDRDTSPSESDATDTRELDKEIGAAGETESHAASEDGHDADNEEFQPAIVNNQAQNELAAQRINIELIEPEWLPPPVYRAMEPPVYIAYKPPPPTLDQKLS